MHKVSNSKRPRRVAWRTYIFAIYHIGKAIVYLALSEGKIWARNAAFGFAALALLGLTALSRIIENNGQSDAIWVVIFAAIDVAAALLTIQTKRSFWKR